MICSGVIPQARVNYQTCFPVSIFHPKSYYLFEASGDQCRFTAVNYFKIPRFQNERIKNMLRATEKHIREEGENLKKLLEQ